MIDFEDAELHQNLIADFGAGYATRMSVRNDQIAVANSVVVWPGCLKTNLGCTRTRGQSGMALWICSRTAAWERTDGLLCFG